MKKFFICALAAMAFVACSENNENGNEPNQKGELEQSFITITLTADDMGVRAEEFEEGLAEERAVKSAHVFFFYEDGRPFGVVYNDGTTTNIGEKNYIKVDLNRTGDDMNNTVSDIHDQVLIINNYKGEYPAKVVAVLNWTPVANSYRLSDLQTALVALGDNTDGYIMSNSVYDNGNADTNNAVVSAVPITPNNIGKMKPGITPSANAVDPVVIYVERVAAKVRYTATATDGIFDVGETLDGSTDGTKIFAKIEGFELFNDYQQSYLLKHIDASWEDTTLGFDWNNAAWFRSYWAKSYTGEFVENNFDWKNNDNTLTINENYNYLGENTYRTEADRTKVIVKATLGTKDAEGNFSSIEIANWYGKNYVGEENLKISVANTLVGLYFSSSDNATFTGITPNDLVCKARNSSDAKAYEVYFQLSNDTDLGVNKTWYKYEDGEYKPITDATLNEELAAIQPALVYNDGMTYYWLDIRHLGVNESDTAYYGVVRNHVYNVNISKISGFGTPVYDSEQDFLKPEKPEAISSYVYAQINILAWRVVENNYEI